MEDRGRTLTDVDSSDLCLDGKLWLNLTNRPTLGKHDSRPTQSTLSKAAHACQPRMSPSNVFSLYT